LNIPAKPTVEVHGNFVDGREIEAGSGEMLDVRNPATGDVIARIPNSTAEDIDRVMKSARAAFEGRAWGGMDIRSRARLVNRLADAFETNLDQLYRLETLNNGRPVNETRAQLSRLPDFFRYFAGLALARRDAVIPVEGSYLNYTLRTPIGIVANCTPFNHPLMIMCKSLAAVLASGCVTVVKPSEYAPLTTLKLAQIFTEAGLPPGVFNVVLGLGQSAGKMLAEHPDINKLVLTGGTEAGRIAGGAAAKVFAHQTMELGGKTPVMVFEDYDVDQAVNYAAFGAFIGAGQTCVCASRHIVHASIYDEFVEKLKAKTLAIRIGDPFDPNTQLGPVISARQRDRVLTYSRFGRDDGARLVTGGVAANVPGHENGYFVEPTVFATSSPTCASSRKKCSDHSLRSRLSRTKPTRCGSPMIPRSGSPLRSGPATLPARIASPPASRPASSGSTIITASIRPRPWAGSMTPASGASSAPKVSRTTSTSRA